jgi:putative ABC transport system permease protein
MFGRLLKGAFARRKGKFLTIALTMALGVSLATAMLNVMLDVGDKVNQELKAYGANLSVVPRGASLLGDLYGVGDGEGISDRYLSESDLPSMKTVFWAFNIVDFAPFIEMRAAVRAAGAAGGLPDIRVVGTWFDKHLDIPTGESVNTGIIRMRSWWSVRGRWVEDAMPGKPSVMLGASLASKLGVGPGDSVTLFEGDSAPPAEGEAGGNTEVTVSGVFESGGEEDDCLFAPIALVQRLSGRPGLVSRAEVSALTTPENDLARRAAQDPGSLSRHEWDTWYCTAYISSIAYQIEEAIPNARAKPILRVAESEGAILQKTQLLMLLLTLLSLACSALALSNLVTASVMERSAEIGLLKAIGATGVEVSLLVMTEITIMALVGGAVGYFAGLGFAQVIGQSVFGSPVAAKALVVPLVALIVLAVTLAGSVPAMRMLLSLRPAEVLHGR